MALRPLELFAGRVCKALGLRKTDVTICLVDDPEIARMNQAFRKKKGPTDVLSFPASERKRPARLTGTLSERQRKPKRRTDGLRRGRHFLAEVSERQRKPKRRTRGGRRKRGPYLGDIVISPATARRNAKQDGRSLNTELEVLILHGMLHLLGFDHERDEGQMNGIEQRLRQRFGLA